MKFQRLRDIGACKVAVDFAEQYPTAQEAWDACDNANWMLWLAGYFSGPPEGPGRKQLVRCAAACAETALPLIRDEELHATALATLQTAVAWCEGEATLEELREASLECWASASRAAAAADAAAAAAAAYAAYAADAAYAAHAAAAAAAASNARFLAMREMAGIVRAHYPRPPGGWS